MKSISILILKGLLLVFLFLFFAPGFHTIEGNENAIDFFVWKLSSEEFKLDKVPEACEMCDGLCNDSIWVPFGILYRHCSTNGYYRTIWGDIYEIEDISDLKIIAPAASIRAAKKRKS